MVEWRFYAQLASIGGLGAIFRARTENGSGLYGYNRLYLFRPSPVMMMTSMVIILHHIFNLGLRQQLLNLFIKPTKLDLNYLSGSVSSKVGGGWVIK